MNPTSDNGLIHLSSPHSVAETTKRYKVAPQSKGITLFCHIDHSGEAEKAGLQMHPTQLLIFGSPKGGAPFMLASPTLAIDLPLKALIWEDAGNKVWLSSNSPEYLQHRHNIPPDLLPNIAGVGTLFKAVVAP